MMVQNNEAKIIVKTTIKIMVLNVFLAIIKVIAGIIGRSSALISDAVNSISDIMTNVVVMVSGKFSHKGRDEDHPYGHEKFDSMVSVLLGVAILITAFEIGKRAVSVIYEFIYFGQAIETPGYIALIVALMTIVIKEFMYHFTKRAAKKAHSSSLNAQALDHRSDELASLGAFIGISGSMLGVHLLEPVASLFITFFVARVGYNIIRSGISQVVDEAADANTIEIIKKIIYSHQEVTNIDELRTRQFGMKLYVDLEIEVDRNLSLCQAHEIAEKVHDHIEEELESVLHCMIHVNPSKKK